MTQSQPEESDGKYTDTEPEQSARADAGANRTDAGEPDGTYTDTEPEHPAPAQAGDNAPLGGDSGTENQLGADNAVEEDMLKALDPDSAPS